MGLGDQISRIIIDVKAETKSARTQLHELNGALEAMGKIAAFAREAIQEYGEHTRLASASAGVNIEKLSGSFKGLINEHDLLTFASRTSHGAFKLTQAEMMRVGEAAVALRNRGFNLKEAVEKLTNAMVKGKAEGLDDFGLSIADADTKAGRLKNIMGELDRVIKESGTTTSDYADDIVRLGNEWDNATAAIKRYTVEALKAQSVGDLFSKGYGQIARQDTGELGFITREIEKQQALASQAVGLRNFQKGIGAGQQNILDRDKLDPGKKAPKSSTSPDVASDFFGGISSSIRTGMLDAVAALNAGEGSLASTTGEIVKGGEFRLRNEGEEQRGREAAIADFRAQSDEFTRLMQAADEARERGRQESILTSLFGEHSEIEFWTESFERLGSVFSGFGEAVGASYEAIVTGQGSASAAFKRVLADSLMATGKQSAIKAIQELALAAGSAAYGNFGSAALHLKSAGLHTAVAVAAGAAANSIGTSSQAAASDKAAEEKAKADEKAKSGSSGGGRSGGGGGDAGDRSRPIVVVLGSAFDETTPRQRAKSAQAAVDKAIRERDE